MNYQEARAFLDEVGKSGSVLGLEGMKELLRRLDNPQDKLKFIHISGTNGKGSELAFLSEILTKSGYRTGRYISPTLYSYRERIQVDKEMIDRDSLAKLTTKVKEAIDGMLFDGLQSPTVLLFDGLLCDEVLFDRRVFDLLKFLEKQCDIVVLETGLGGTLDATNVVTTTVLEVIASIGMDHMMFLGNTLGEIAKNKAGIIKPGTLVVSAKQEPEAEEVVKKVSEEKHATLSIVNPEEIKDVHYGYETQRFSYKNWKDIEISLAGTYQIKNAALALEAVETLRSLGYQLSEETVRKGMKEATWRGRFSVIHKAPVVVIDGAHNPAAATVLKESLETYFKGKNLYYIFGVFADKDYEKVIELTAPLAKQIVTVQTPNNPRALPAEELKKAVEKVNPNVKAAKSVAEAVEEVKAMTTKDDVVIVFGSLSFLSLADEAWNR